MKLFRLFTRPVRNLTDAIFMPFKAAFVVGLCGLVNWMTFNGHWWVKWVALGMGIAVLLAFARAARTLLVLAIVAWGGHWILKRYGADARARFDAWAERTQPQAREVIEMVQRGPAGAG